MDGHCSGIQLPYFMGWGKQLRQVWLAWLVWHHYYYQDFKASHLSSKYMFLGSHQHFFRIFDEGIYLLKAAQLRILFCIKCTVWLHYVSHLICILHNLHKGMSHLFRLARGLLVQPAHIYHQGAQLAGE